MIAEEETFEHRVPIRIILIGAVIAQLLVLGLPQDAVTASSRSPAAAPTIIDETLRTNLRDYPDGRVPRYQRLEIAFDLADVTATNPYFSYDPSPPPGIEPGIGITVEALLLPPGVADWAGARILPCFYYQPVREIADGPEAALLPFGEPEWRCRFTPDVVGSWRYKIRVTDARGTTESAEHTFACAPSDQKGFIEVSDADPRFFEFSDGTPFVTPLINVEQSSPFNTLSEIRTNIRRMGEHGVRFVRWFPTGEGDSYFVAPYADSIRINWFFGSGWITADDVDPEAGQSFSYRPYYYTRQTLPVRPDARYRLSFRAKVEGDRVLHPEVGHLEEGTVDICSTTGTYHESRGETCTYRREGWADYALIVETGGLADAAEWNVALRGLYVSDDAPAPYNQPQAGSIRVHSIALQRDESGSGDWGPNLLTRSDPDTHRYIDQRAAAKLDEILKQSERYGVYHKLTLFHKNDALLARLQPDGTIGPQDVDHFYADEGEASRWYQKAYVRYFVARWSYSPALHSLELGNENNFDEKAQEAAYAIAEHVHALSPRHILMSNSFWGWWIADFWTDPERGDLMDYADKHWYADTDGSGCDDTGTACELISNVWADSAAYVRECRARFVEYASGSRYRKPIVRGEGGVAESGTQPQHPAIATDSTGTYYHKKLWSHLGVLGYSCDGEWYPRLFVPEEADGFPNPQHNLYTMFANYERFIADEPLSNGRYAEIGTDLSGAQAVVAENRTGSLRAWGVQDDRTGRTLLWVDNADHTWTHVVAGMRIAPASATLTLSGFRSGEAYTVQWWDTHAAYEGMNPIERTTLTTAASDGTFRVSIEGLEKDLALKIAPFSPPKAMTHHCYLPLIVRETS